MAEETALEMFVGGLVMDPNTQAPVIILKDESGAVALPIWIGIPEATSIASAIKQLNMPRPLTHDLMADIFTELGVKVQRIMITELKESTYFAELILSFGDKILIFDSRPSDAIAIALRASAPIFVTQHVLEQAKMSFGPAFGQGQKMDPSAKPSGSESSESQAEEAQAGQPKSDFTNIHKDKWVEILADLDADDFKYKM